MQVESYIQMQSKGGIDLGGVGARPNPAEIYKPLSRNIFLELLRGLFSGAERGCEKEHLIKAVSEEILIAVRNCFLNWLQRNGVAILFISGAVDPGPRITHPHLLSHPLLARQGRPGRCGERPFAFIIDLRRVCC